jgi:catechol 2,3-dioxygenase-like lactoylglutathione lyase family enzyme
MIVSGLQHLNLRCARSDLPRLEQFYRDVVGLHRGARPSLRSEGIWMYAGTCPIVHISARCEENFIKAEHQGSFDHIAFAASGAATLIDRLTALGIRYDAQQVPGAGFQIFITDPLGTALEFNFPDSEAPDRQTAT